MNKSDLSKQQDVDRYIASFPQPVRVLLTEVRQAILKAAPGAEEAFAYGMPAYRLRGPLVYFAGYKAHIGFYPTASGIAAFQKELSVYKGAKGSVQFPLDQPLPLALIAKIVRFRVAENKRLEEERLAKKQAKKAGASKKVAEKKSVKTSAAKNLPASKPRKPSTKTPSGS